MQTGSLRSDSTQNFQIFTMFQWENNASFWWRTESEIAHFHSDHGFLHEANTDVRSMIIIGIPKIGMVWPKIGISVWDSLAKVGLFSTSPCLVSNSSVFAARRRLRARTIEAAGARKACLTCQARPRELSESSRPLAASLRTAIDGHLRTASRPVVDTWHSTAKLPRVPRTPSTADRLPRATAAQDAGGSRTAGLRRVHIPQQRREAVARAILVHHLRRVQGSRAAEARATQHGRRGH